MLTDNKNIKALDGIRGYSILMVVLSHIGLGHIIPGGFGVTVFFFVSGFLICKLLLFELFQNGKINFYSFYIRRIIRLYPALLFFLVSAIAIFILLDYKLDANEILASLFYYMNYNMVFFRDASVHPFHNVFNILWSLSIEEHFYFIFPIFLLFTFRKGLHFVFFSLIVITTCLFFRIYYGYTLLNSNLYENYNYHLTHTRMDSIMYGCLTAFLLYGQSNVSKKVYEFLVNRIVITLALLFILFTLLFRNHFFRETYRYTIQGIALSSLIIAIIYDRIKFVSILFSGKIIVFIGRLSYSLYLFHWIGVSLASTFYPRFSCLNWYLIFFPTTIVLSLISYFFVEMPFVGLRKKYGSNVNLNKEMENNQTSPLYGFEKN